MNSQALNGKRVAILATDGFEESELSVPKASWPATAWTWK